MAIISQETWDNMPKEEKEQVIQKYSHLLQVSDNDDSWEVRMCANSEKQALITLFGKENLQPKPKTPKTWKDYKEIYPENDDDISDEFRNKIARKIRATTIIARLIELGYGGIPTPNCGHAVAITPRGINGDLKISQGGPIYEFPRFNSVELAKEFMSYPENVELVKQYYMI